MGRTPRNTFGLSPRLPTLADVGVLRDEFDAIDAEVAAAIEWPEFSTAVKLPADASARVASIHASMADLLGASAPARRSKRRKLWE